MNHSPSVPPPVQPMRSARWVSPLSGWRAVRAIAAVLAWVLATIGLTAVGSMVAGRVLGERPSLVVDFLVLGVLSTIGALLGMWLHVVRPLGQGWSIIGWCRPQHSMWHVLWQAPLIMITAATTQVLLMALLGRGEAPTSGNNQAIGDIISSVNAAQLVAVIVVAAVIVPIWEELAFRGLIYGSLRTRLRLVPAIISGGLIFGLAHANPLTLGYLTVAGMGFCLLTEWYKSSIPTMVCHGFNNGCACLVLVMTL